MPKPHAYADEMAALDAITPQTHPARDAVHFRRIIAARKSVDDAKAELAAAVEAARDAGDSWTIIGAALGTSRQGAFRKFGHGEGAEVVPIGRTTKRSAQTAAFRANRSAARAPTTKVAATKRTTKPTTKATPAKASPKRAAKATPAKVAAKATQVAAAAKSGRSAATGRATKTARATTTKSAAGKASHGATPRAKLGR